ncbi:MAG TPA: DUF192 domain-containing protein [Alphaproteobacteria bacterium]|nr:DUF192 domain-containing protein [Alphaproteobacteria bacterium]
MKNTLWALFRGLTVAILTCIASIVALAASDSHNDSTVVIATRDARHVFTIEIARTPAEMQRGLMFRSYLAPDHGMLFLYEEDRPVSFWMKNTFIPLDLFFTDASGRIVRIAERTVPLSTERISSEEPVRAVLEVNGGTASRLQVKVGDRLIHPALSD